MIQVKVVRTNEGKKYAFAGEQIWFKATGDDTEGRMDFAISEIGYLAGPPLHIHHNQDEAFYMLAGKMRFQIDNEIIDAQVGDFIFAPKGVPHTFVNIEQRPAKMVVTISPGGFNSFFDDLAALPPGPPDPIKLAEIGAKYNASVVGPPIAVTMGLIER